MENLSELTKAMADDMRVDAKGFARYKTYLGLDDDDAKRLRALIPEVSSTCRDFAETLCAELLQFDETRGAMEQSHKSLERIEQNYKEQILALVSGHYDYDFKLARMQNGIGHHQNCLEPKWFIGAYRHYFDCLSRAALKTADGDTALFVDTLDSICKIILLDIALGTRAYVHVHEEKLRLFAKVFESDLEAVLITDTAGNIIHASHMVLAISGYPAAALTGCNVELLHSERNDRSFAAVWSQVAEKGAWRGRHWHRHAMGHDYLASMSIAAVKDERGRVTHYVVEYSDETETWEAERALKRRTDELAYSNRELEQFAYVASHDLQEPLRMVASYAQLLARRYKDKLDKDAHEFIGFAVDGATRMQSLINDLLKLSRVGTQVRPSAPISCTKILRDTLSNLELAIQESAAVVTSDPLPTINGDEILLIQLFQNLIGNAIKFRAADRPVKIHVGARHIDDAWEFSISDNGMGIAPEHFDRIFVIFQQIQSKSEHPGNGIGLALCKKIVERHGGKIWVVSRLGEGATFFFTIADPENSVKKEAAQ
ncbi:MAG: Phytochrome-like protein cph1 [Betaproteobacteria bacterium ADurb.Bin341]|nr:MAG: Phytochrome-like protein cph1 [Betaproteobacteria bacterium ADurb.Bin341]